MHVLKKTVNILINILIVLLLLISVLTAVMSISSGSSGAPNLFGYAFFSVQSESMVPTFSPGDLIVSKIVDDDTELQVGDVITFIEEVDGTSIYNSHRIVDIKSAQGMNFYYTKGDNSPAMDEQPVSDMDVVAKYSGTCIPGVGTVYDFLRSQLGFFLVILLPLILFFLYEVFRVIRNLIDYNREKALAEAAKAAAAVSAESSGLTEEQMKEALQNYLEKQKNEKNSGSSQVEIDNSETKD